MPEHIDEAFVDKLGTMLFLREPPNAGIWGMKYDFPSHSLHGEMFPIETGASTLSISDTGSLLFVKPPSKAALYELYWIDRTGKPGESLGKPHAEIHLPRLSPDGSHAAFVAMPDPTGTNFSLFVYDLHRDAETRLTFSELQDENPIWLPSGKHLAFKENTTKTETRLMAVAADGSEDAAPLVSRSALGSEMVSFSIAPDSRTLVAVFRNAGRDQLLAAPIGADVVLGQFSPFLKEATEFDLEEPEISPDGRLLAYVVRNAEGPEVFVTRFPSGAGRWQVSTGGGRMPRWARGTGALFYLADSGTESRSIVAVAMRPALDPPVGASTRLFDLGESSGAALDRGYEVSSDGKRLLMVRPSSLQKADSARLVLVQNDAAEIRRLLREAGKD